ncbi:cytoskeleton-associated protein 2-like [Ochotona curzoniae]|uniref:cytoskeleton-associated protein 2-like n=1 Tax=Ochotona curzoniae TaxID=130825 RepID=UPI001B345A72|nr:cytoskeleton-associated protein 2-like [Ochotona curzoniae]
MSTPPVPRDLKLPPSRRSQSEFREQRKQKLKEHLLRRKTFFSLKQENRILSSCGNQTVMISEDQIQKGTRAPNLKVKMADKENINRPIKNKNNAAQNKDGIPLKPSNELNSSAAVIGGKPLHDENQAVQLPVKDDCHSQHMTLSQAYHLKNNNKKPVTVEKTKQDSNMPKKPVLGAYRGQIVQSKVNSFRKPHPGKDVSSTTTKTLMSAISKVPKPQPVNTSSATVKSEQVSHKTAQGTQLVRPPIRSHQIKTHHTREPGVARSSASVTIRKGPQEKQSLQSKAAFPSIKASTSQDIRRNQAQSRGVVPTLRAKPAAASTTKLVEKPKPTGQQRPAASAKAAVSSKAGQPKETAEQRRSRLSEWKAAKDRVLKRPPNPGVKQPEPKEQEETPVGSFWTTMAEEDEQRLFTDKVNKTIAECLNLISAGCQKEEILATLNDLIKNIPDAKKLVKYWICIAKLEADTSSVEEIIGIYEKALLAGAQPMEELRHVIADILTTKTQEANLGGKTEEACGTKEETQEDDTEEKGLKQTPVKQEAESKHHSSVAFADCEEEQDDKTKDSASDVLTPSTEAGSSSIIKYNVSTTPFLQSAKKKMQFDETNSVFKELKFLTPVRRSRRIQEKTSKLPDMLKDHYPCVSLEQLSELGNETDAFVYRPNAALWPMYSETNAAEEE